MRYFRLHTTEHKIRIYPLVCWHVGAQQSDTAFIREHIKRIKDDEFARWIYMGDGGECVTKQSKGQIYEQTMNPQEQFNHLLGLLSPIKEKGLFGVTGNHDRRIFKETGMNFAESLMLALGLPYFGNSVLWRLQVNRTNYDIFCHHGIDSGANIGTKVNKARSFDQFILADAMFTAHSHICMDLPPKLTAILDTDRDDPIRWLSTYEYICGCAHDSRIPGYAEEKGYPPVIPAQLAVEFNGTRKDGEIIKRQMCTIWRRDA